MDATSSLGVAIAFTAGLLSFLSPCVLPLVPSYVTFITGLSLDDVQRARRTALIHAVLFILGFTLIFLALGAGAALTRFLTEALRTEMRQPYVTTARALGITRRRIVLTQALRNALPATITVLGIQFGTLLGGAVLVEAIFTWPGLGGLVGEAISGRDYPLVQVLLLLSVGVFVLVQLVTDIVHAWLDPRVRITGGVAA